MVGICSHIAAIIWYQAKGRHEGETRGVRNWGEHVLDAADIPPSVDESDSDDSFCADVSKEMISIFTNTCPYLPMKYTCSSKLLR